jgi:hypothetical protein
LNKNDSIEKLQLLKNRAIPLAKLYESNNDFEKWYRDSKVALENIFGKGSSQVEDFTSISYSSSVWYTGMPESVNVESYQSGVKSAITLFESLIDEINDYWSDEKHSKKDTQGSDLETIKLIINRFHQVARQLRKRYSDRETIEIEDEYDVQDLFHALLKLYFNDIRPEEYTPSYAGSSSRVDFLLKSEKIVIEIKKTRKNLKAKELGEQLIVDIARYHSHPDCKHLICFAYDPEGRIANPVGIENDLSKKVDNINVSVFINPK